MAKYRFETVALVAAGLMLLLAFGCGEGTEGDTGSTSLSQTEATNNGQCNQIIATGLRTAQVCYRSGCDMNSDECAQFGMDFGEYFNSACATDFFLGEAEGLASSAALHPQTGEIKHIGEVICSGVVQCDLCDCNFPDVCGTPCGCEIP